jgi:hypothetical protein
MHVRSARRRATAITAVVACALLTGPLGAQRVAIGARTGSLGLGAELTASVASKLNVRVGLNQYTYSRQDDDDSFDFDSPVAVSIDTDAKLSSVTAMLDYLPFNNFLRLSAGLMLNSTKATTLITPTESYTMGDKTFTPERIGTLTGTTDWEQKMAPYVGIGFGNAAKATGRFGVQLDVGAFHTGAPRFELAGTNMLAPTADQGPSINDGMKDFAWYPQVSLGISYRVR